jgi:hypothetical protein
VQGSDRGSVFEGIRTIAAFYLRADSSAICECIQNFGLNDLLFSVARLELSFKKTLRGLGEGVEGSIGDICSNDLPLRSRCRIWECQKDWVKGRLNWLSTGKTCFAHACCSGTDHKRNTSREKSYRIRFPTQNQTKNIALLQTPIHGHVYS